MSKLTDIVWELASPAAERRGCEVWDVEFVKEAGQRYLRVFIDKADSGVSIDDCEAVSLELDAVLDERDLIAESYIFEVSSAGAERQLKRPSDFERFIGHEVEVKLYQASDGKKTFVGTLTGYADGGVTITDAEGERSFEKAQVANVRLWIDWRRSLQQ